MPVMRGNINKEALEAIRGVHAELSPQEEVTLGVNAFRNLLSAGKFALMQTEEAPHGELIFFAPEYPGPVFSRPGSGKKGPGKSEPYRIRIVPLERPMRDNPAHPGPYHTGAYLQFEYNKPEDQNIFEISLDYGMERLRKMLPAVGLSYNNTQEILRTLLLGSAVEGLVEMQRNSPHQRQPELRCVY